MSRCASCGHDSQPEARFCSSCGIAMVDLVAGSHEERKIVSVLFADLVGFTTRSERLDPEDVRALLSPYYARLRSELERFGGTVEKFIGDAVMALFGAPVAHEDDPERAVRAALAIRDWVLEQPEDLQLRIAVNTGEALVSLGARLTEGEGMASGDVVNTAARLQAAAPINGILVGEMTYHATSHVINYRAAAPVVAKGKAEPVPIWEAITALTTPGSDFAAPRRTPLVGRIKELRVLTESLERARSDHTPQMVTIAGAPGIGKSRLLAELRRAVDQEPAEIVVWRQGRSLPYGDGVTFWALTEIVKGQAGILDTDTPEQTQAKLRAVVKELLPDRGDAQRVEDHLRPLVGLSSGAQENDTQSEAFAAWQHFFEALAERQPLMLVFEDLHWADDNLLDFIEYLVDWTGTVPLLVVCTARPELFERRAGWGGGKRNAVSLSLAPLSEEETTRLIGNLVEHMVMPGETRQALLARAGGNPLYAEQYVRMMIERADAEELPLPETIQGIIAARVDGLSPEEKGLLQNAAVVGKVFWLGALTHVGGLDRRTAELCLHGLQRKDFVHRARHSTMADGAEYAFLHVLVRDVAYGQIPRRERAEKHRLAAEWIESLGRTEDHAEMLAHHYRSAVELRRAAGQPVDDRFAERVLESLRAAGDRAFSLHAYASAAGFYLAALELASGATRCEVLLALGDAQARAGDGAASKQTFLQAADLSRSLGLKEHLARAALGYGGRLAWARAGADPHVIPLLQEGLAAAGEEDNALKAEILARLGGALRDDPSPEPRESLGRQGVDMARRLGDPATLAFTLEGLHGALWRPDNPLERLAIASELGAVGRAAADWERVMTAHESRLFAFFDLGDLQSVNRELDAIDGVLEEQRLPPARRWAPFAIRVPIALLEGRFQEAELCISMALRLRERTQPSDALMAQAVQLFLLRREQGRLTEVEELVRSSAQEFAWYPMLRCALVCVHCELGGETEARTEFEAMAADDFARLPFDNKWLFSLSLLSEVANFLGDDCRARTLYEKLLPYADRTAFAAADGCNGSVSRYLGLLATVLGRSDEGERHFREGIARNEQIGARPFVAHTQNDLAVMLIDRGGTGDVEQAIESLYAARVMCDDLGMPALHAKVTNTIAHLGIAAPKAKL
jgi:class 3 adenylate cyclase